MLFLLLICVSIEEEFITNDYIHNLLNTPRKKSQYRLTMGFFPMCAIWHPRINYREILTLADQKCRPETSRTVELILQARANDSNLPSTFPSYNKPPALPAVPRLILEQIDSKDKLLSHPLKPRRNCPSFCSKMGVHTSSSTSWFLLCV